MPRPRAAAAGPGAARTRGPVAGRSGRRRPRGPPRAPRRRWSRSRPGCRAASPVSRRRRGRQVVHDRAGHAGGEGQGHRARSPAQRGGSGPWTASGRSGRCSSPLAGAETIASLGTARATDARSSARPIRTPASRRTASRRASRPGTASSTWVSSSPRTPKSAADTATTGAPASTSVTVTVVVADHDACPAGGRSGRGDPCCARPGRRSPSAPARPGTGRRGWSAVAASASTPPGVSHALHDQLAGVGVEDADGGLAAAGGHPALADRERGHHGRAVAAVAAPVDLGLLDPDLGEGVLHVDARRSADGARMTALLVVEVPPPTPSTWRWSGLP